MARLLVWLPLCGLVVSLFVPPGADDAGGLLRFVGATLAVVVAAIVLAVVAERTRFGWLYPRLLGPLALAVLLVAAVTSALT